MFATDAVLLVMKGSVFTAILIMIKFAALRCLMLVNYCFKNYNL